MCLTSQAASFEEPLLSARCFSSTPAPCQERLLEFPSLQNVNSDTSIPSKEFHRNIANQNLCRALVPRCCVMIQLLSLLMSISFPGNLEGLKPQTPLPVYGTRAGALEVKLCSNK